MSDDVLTALLQEELVRASRTIFAKGLVQRGEGNVSVRHPGRDEFYVTPTFNDYANMTTSDVVHLNMAGEQLGGLKRASSEYRLHIAIYRARPRVGAVIHTHSNYATMLAVARMDLPILLEEMVVWVGGPVRCTAFGEANTEVIADRALETLGDTNALLLANHGVMVCGRSLEHAVKTAELVEKMAFIFKGASDLGQVHTISDQAFRYFRSKFDDYYATH
jgi:L-fuculose-phosphate aldolase